MIGNILGSIVKGVLPIIASTGSEVIKTKFEENVLDACQRELFNKAVDVVSDCIVSDINRSIDIEPKQQPVVQQIYVQQPTQQCTHRLDDSIIIEDNSKYQFELRNFQ